MDRVRPTVGRIVHFYNDHGLHAAIITKVHPDDLVDLFMFGDDVILFARDIAWGEDGNAGGRHWEWPPR